MVTRYIYALQSRYSGKVAYVGCTNDPCTRLASHNCSPAPLGEAIKAGADLRFWILAICYDIDVAPEIESEFIARCNGPLNIRRPPFRVSRTRFDGLLAAGTLQLTTLGAQILHRYDSDVSLSELVGERETLH